MFASSKVANFCPVFDWAQKESFQGFLNQRLIAEEAIHKWCVLWSYTPRYPVLPIVGTLHSHSRNLSLFSFLGIRTKQCALWQI